MATGRGEAQATCQHKKREPKRWEEEKGGHEKLGGHKKLQITKNH